MTIVLSSLAAELEMAYYEMATKAGVKMMPCWLMEIEGEKHFVTKRFDRKGEKKLHMQTLAALYPEADSYERLLWVCRKMRLSEPESEEVYRRMVFNILANNTDDHNKNFSFLMDEQGRWTLSPSYDMTYIFNTGGFLPETNHCLMICGKMSGITKEDVLLLAKGNGIRKAKEIISEVATSIKEFRPIATKYGVQDRWIAAVENTLNKNLEDWGLLESVKPKASFIIDGHTVTDFHLEQQFKGNYCLQATVDGQSRKYIIRKGTPENDAITNTGLANLTEEMKKMLVERYCL